MIFRRGNPLDYERWGADPGMGTWDYAHCLPYFKRMESALAADRKDEFRGHAGRWCWNAARPPSRCSAPSSKRAAGGLRTDRRRQRLPPEGFGRSIATSTTAAGFSAARAYLASGEVAVPTSRSRPARFVTKILFEGTRAVGVEYVHGKGPAKRVRAGEVVLSGGASTPRNSCSSRAWARRRTAASAIDVVADRPGVREPRRTTSRSTCSTPASSRSRSRRA
jgi:choline dehydrogenase